MLVLGNEGGGGSSSHAKSSYIGPKDWFKEASDFDFEYSSNIQLKPIFLFFLPMFDPKTNMIFSISTIQPYVCVKA